MKQTPKSRDWGRKSEPVFRENDNTFTPEKGARAVEMFRSGMSMAQICSHKDMPTIRQLYKWRTLDAEFGAAWTEAKAEHESQDRNAEYQYQIEVAEEIFIEYGTTKTSLAKVCASCENYPSYAQIHKWSQNNPKVREMRVMAEEAKAVYLAEEAMELADELNPEDPRAATLRLRARHWLAERLWKAKFGQQTAIAEEDDLVNRSQAELEDVLRNTVKELEAAGFKMDSSGNVH